MKVNATNDYLRECQSLWIVSPISRIASDTTVDRLVARYGERFEGRLAIIATNSDHNVAPALAKDYKDKERPIKTYERLTPRSVQLQNQISLLKTKITSRKQAQDTPKRAAKLSKLNSDLQEAIDEKSDIDNARWYAVVKTRNDDVTVKLQDALKGHLPEGQQLPMFFVSNQHYSTLKGVEEAGKFQLDAEATGIPSLRRYALGLAAPGLLRSLEDYTHHQFTVFFEGVYLWVIREYVQGAKALKAIVGQPKHGLDSKLALYLDELSQAVHEHLTEPLQQRSPKFSKAAIALFEQKQQQKHWATIRAFLRKDGKHESKLCSKEVWTEQFYEPAIKQIGMHWPKVKKAQDALLEYQSLRICRDVDVIKETLDQEPACTALEMSGFHAVFRGATVGVKAAVAKHQEVFQQELQ